MKKYLLLTIAFMAAFSSCLKDRVSTATSGPVVVGDRKLIHYWSFNSGSDSTSLAIPDTTIGGGTIHYAFTDTGHADAVSPGSSLNLRMGADSGSGLRVRIPFKYWTLYIPTTGYKQPIVQFVVERSNSGPTTNDISYTIDGQNFITTGLSATSVTLGTTWALFSLDFSAIPSVDDNPKFAIKFNNSTTATGGNNRYDNISVDAFPK